MESFEQLLDLRAKRYLEEESLTLQKWLLFISLIAIRETYQTNGGILSISDRAAYDECVFGILKADLEASAMLYCIAAKYPDAMQILRDWWLINSLGKPDQYYNPEETCRRLLLQHFQIRLKV